MTIHDQIDRRAADLIEVLNRLRQRVTTSTNGQLAPLPLARLAIDLDRAAGKIETLTNKLAQGTLPGQGDGPDETPASGKPKRPRK